MRGKYILIGFLASLGAIVVIVGLGILALAFDLTNPSAFVMLAAAVTGLVAIASRFVPGDRG